MILIQNVRVIDAQRDQMADVVIDDGKIVKMAPPSPDSPESELVCREVINGTGKILFPGLIDPHVHFREPGFVHKEDLHTGSCAAAAGGVTTFFDMPNTMPPTFTEEALEEKRALATKKSIVNYGLFFGSNPENTEEIKKASNIPGVKMYLNTTTGNLKMDDESAWPSVFHASRKVALHAEGDTFARAVEIWKSEGAPCELHLCHMSLAQEVEIIRKLKQDEQYRAKISCEVCPHHLLMTKEDRAKYGAFCCMKPPLADHDDQDILWEAVEDGTVDFFATDHAPHTRSEKAEDPPPYGIPGVETLFNLIFDQWLKRGWDLKTFAAMMSHNTAQIYHFENKKGLIAPGYDADLVLVDPTVEISINAAAFHSKCDWSPFDGWKMQGKLEKTWCGGKLVFDEGEVMDEVRGSEITFQDQ